MPGLNDHTGNGDGPAHRPAPEIAWAPPELDTGSDDARPGVNRRTISVDALLRHKWLALGLFLLFAIPAVAAAWLLTKPLYEARATVEVSPMIPRIVYETEQSGIIPLYAQYLNDQVGVLRSPTVLERVLDSPEVQQTEWYRQQPQPILGSPPAKLDRLRREVNASVRPRTSFVDIEMTGPDPTTAALIVNTVVDEYLKFVNEKAQRFDDDVYKVLSEEYNSLQATIDGLKSVVADLRGDLLTATPEELQSQQRQRLDAQIAALEDRERAVALAEWRREQLLALQAAAPATSSQPAVAQAPYAMDPEWREYFMALKTAEQDVAAKSESLGENNYELLRARQDVVQARQRLEIREGQLEELLKLNPDALVAAEGQGQTLQQQIEAAGREIKQLGFEQQLQAKAVQRERDRLEKTAASAEMLAKELDKLHHAEQRFEDVRQRKVAMEIERRAPASIRIQDRAYPPSVPANSKRRVMLLALAIAGAAAAAGGLTLLRVTGNPAVETPAELAATSAPFLGEVPWLSRKAPAAHEAAAQAEYMRMVRTALLQRLGDGAGHALQITSADAGSGKTSATVLLGESLGRCGKRVLMVDADLRRPALHTRTGVEQAPGLVDVLRGGMEPDAALRPWPQHAAVDVLPAGDVPVDEDDELIAGVRLAECLAQWRRRYDVILFDGPPLLPVADARILARRLDGNLLVIREGHSRRADVSDAMSSLRGAGGDLLGVIFFARGRRGRYYGGSYGYGGGYGYGPRQPAAVLLDARES